MNVENILKVADAIEQHSIPDLGFNMAEWYENSSDHEDKSGHSCGTVACIGGTAGVVLAGIEDCGEFEATDLLGLTPAQASLLFYPNGSKEDWNKITTVQAVRTLRHLAATGKVKWNFPETEGATP